MAVLNIRNVPDHVHRRLRIRAARAGRSMEAEAREILAAACDSEDDTESPAALPDWIDSLYNGKKPKRVVQGLLAERRREAGKE